MRLHTIICSTLVCNQSSTRNANHRMPHYRPFTDHAALVHAHVDTLHDHSTFHVSICNMHPQPDSSLSPLQLLIQISCLRSLLVRLPAGFWGFQVHAGRILHGLLQLRCPVFLKTVCIAPGTRPRSLQTRQLVCVSHMPYSTPHLQKLLGKTHYDCLGHTFRIVFIATAHGLTRQTRRTIHIVC